MKHYYLRRGKAIKGPIEPARLRSLAEAGKIRPDDLIAHAAEGPWAKAEKVKGLLPTTFAAVPAIAAKAAAPRPKRDRAVERPVVAIPVEEDEEEPEPPRAGISKQRIAVWTAAGVGVVACCLPWVQAPIVGAVNGYATLEGQVSLGAFVLCGGLGLVGARPWPMPTWARGVATALGLVALGLGCWVLGRILTVAPPKSDNKMAEAMAQALIQGMQPGAGVVVAIGAAAALVGVVWLVGRPRRG